LKDNLRFSFNARSAKAEFAQAQTKPSYFLSLYWYTYRVELSEQEFDKYLSEAIDKIPMPYRDHIENVAFILEDEPTFEQRQRLNLYPNETLFGLYEGVPLPARGGVLKLLPDKITIFKNPLVAASRTASQLRENIGHTVWHEVAHYFGLDHRRIHELDRRRRQGS
jgi:predicted Zn-dependent protease with MMP-like domain